MRIELLTGFAGNTMVLWAILSLAALGGLCSERSGVVNIGLEGKMLMAACLCALTGSATGNPLMGLIAGIGGAIVLSLLHFVLTQYYSMDQIVSGMAINLLSFGVTNFLNEKYRPAAGQQGVPIAVFAGFALISGLYMAYYLRRTKGGLHLLAVGNDPSKSRQCGLDPIRVRFLAQLGTGFLCGVSGVLVMTNTGGFTDLMTAGRGFIALAALIIGGWRPIPVMLSCLLFAALEAAQILLQGQVIGGVVVPPAVWNCVPYAMTLFALAGFLGQYRPPRGLGKP